VRRVATALAAVVLVGSFVASAFPAAADVSPQDVEAARQRLREVSAELENEVARYEAAVLVEEELRLRLDQILLDLTARERELVMARRSARERVAEMYMAAGSQDATATALLAFEDFRDVPARLAYLDTVAATDREVVNQLEAARRGYVRQQELLRETTARQAMVRTEMEVLLDDIYSRLEATNADYQAVKAEWEAQEAERLRREEEERLRRERELFLATSTTTTLAPPPPTAAPATTTTVATGTTPTGSGDTTTTVPADVTTTVPAETTTTTAAAPTTTAPPPPTPGVRVCPVDGATTFRDSWGEPRPGGRSHTGVDMLAPIGTPLVAIESGTIWSPNWHYAGGLGLYIDGDSGDRWYYAHLSGYAAGIADGTRVGAGQLVGFVGDTGNASVPHLHLGWLPGGAYYDNPFPIVAGLCW
jgi:murein DD-endopeptidase MepM/ murein hydrolase activator NlpD